MRQQTTTASMPIDHEIIIIGGGISGIGAGIRLNEHGLTDYIILEQAADLGGTWRDNHYPGVAVDIPSFSYAFSFEPNPNWSRLYATGAEINHYVHHCADKYDIRNKIQFNSGVESTSFDPSNNIWSITLKNGSKLACRYIISATGVLNQPVIPDIKGLDSFKGTVMHSAQWNDNFRPENRKIAVIGTGASAVQIVPAIAKQTKHLTVFQRTPIWVAPKTDIRLDDKFQDFIKQYPFTQKITRALSDAYLELGSFSIVNYQALPFMAKTLEALCKNFLKQQVKDPELRKKLTPSYGFGCKRPAISNGYLRSFNRDNVMLETTGIKEINANGVVANDDKEHNIDTIIFATGFKTLEPGNAPSYEVYGLDNIELGAYWYQNRYQAYNGISVPKFPNYFMTYGPYSGGLNWFTMLENHLKHIIRCIETANRKKATRVEVKQAAHDRYFEAMIKKSNKAVFKDSACIKANSYYLDHHGDASAPAPFTPWWRVARIQLDRLNGYRFSR